VSSERNAGREPHWSGDEVFADLVERADRIRRESQAGPMAVLTEREHPVVRGAMRSSRRERRVSGTVCLGVPLLVFLATLLAADASRPVVGGYSPAELAGAFLCVWPLACFLGAALRASGGVLDEVRRNTVLQLVLTPLPARPLAAAKIVPAAQPFLLGIFASLPLYLALGGSDLLLGDETVALPMVFWPLRLLAGLWALLGPSSWEFRPSGPGAIAGGFMCLADLGMVWAAANWGASYAVRLRGLGTSLAYVGVRLLIAAGLQILFWLPMSISWGGDYSDYRLPVRMVCLGLQLALMLVLLWWFVVRRAALRAISEFAYFDRLADEEFIPRYVRVSKVWQRWDDTART